MAPSYFPSRTPSSSGGGGKSMVKKGNAESWGKGYRWHKLRSWEHPLQGTMGVVKWNYACVGSCNWREQPRKPYRRLCGWRVLSARGLIWGHGSERESRDGLASEDGVLVKIEKEVRVWKTKSQSTVMTPFHRSSIVPARAEGPGRVRS